MRGNGNGVRAGGNGNGNGEPFLGVGVDPSDEGPDTDENEMIEAQGFSYREVPVSRSQ